MLNRIVANTENYTREHQKSERKDKGQFFTPLSIANFMAQKAAIRANHLSILEPGAGNGILTAALVKYCLDLRLCSSFSVRFIENDPDIQFLLEQTAILLQEYVVRHHGNIDISILNQNYITESEDNSYDIVICNPPYKKIRKDSEEAIRMREYVFGQPNLYMLFMCRAINNLNIGGKFVFITPRSWTSGSYYKLTRRFLLENLNLTDLLLFDDRDKVFDGEDVLQETLITVGEKSNQQQPYINMYTTPQTYNNEMMRVNAEEIKSIGTDAYLLLPSSQDDLRIINQMNSITDTFESLGYCFKTGPVVEFRNKDALSKKRRDGYVPMYRTANIINGRCVFPVDSGKAQYVNEDKKKLLIANRNTVFLRRLSAKEERRRLQSCVYYKTDEDRYISIENHVNYLVHVDNSPLSTEEAEWINELLMSNEYDVYYRAINGSTQVNASEINKLPLQRRESE